MGDEKELLFFGENRDLRNIKDNAGEENSR